MATVKMNVEKREEIGKNRVNKMREEHLIPGVIYCRGEETLTIAVEQKEFQKAYKEAGIASIIQLHLDGKNIPVIIREIQRHPVSNHILHLDFFKLHMNQKVRMEIPIILHNKDHVKIKPSILSQILDQIEIECLPKDIPHAAEVDVAEIDFSTPILVKDLDIVQNSKITIFKDLNDVVCTLTEPPKEEAKAVEETTEAAEAVEAKE
jgi:large subunit ribosomal protein L25